MTNYTARRRGAPSSHGRRRLCRSPSSSSSGSSFDLPPLSPELDHKLAIAPSIEYDEDSDVPRWRGRLQPRPSMMNSPKRPTQNAPIQRQQQSYSDDDESDASMEDSDADYEMSESGESAIDADKRSLKVISHDATAHRRDIKAYDLDFAMDYKFKRGETALVKCFGRWYHGQILKPYRDSQRPQASMGVSVPSYDVFFRDEWNRLRAVATPLDGCLKPDTLEFRQLFEEAGVEIYSRC
ncbi:uncharacterized protein LAESUDRAFT_712584 [Laetiporus sulphureus 93-53]|uniref:Uncharacterized protein n=1 Tax=Laetiporus sulphureus 93-53 TaxID=1314785 RepID=A0A165FHU9_9APHY|nr:uncharacterized protein LAESUDRAFT_712584 [Laetiporus sulphureus 93-53]KZT08994.1 hypothetical protein LAESUDRAFT_712584 [Laetiporus sulphureus 93-53]